MDITEPENQIIHGHQKERSLNAGLDCIMCLAADLLSIVTLKIEEILAANP